MIFREENSMGESGGISVSVRLLSKHWALLFPLAGIPAAYYAAKNYFGLENGQVLTHWFFWTSSALFVVFWWLFKPGSLPEDILVVAVAPFLPANPETQKESADISRQIGRRLMDSQSEGVPLQVKYLSRPVTGKDERERRQSVLRLSQSREGRAHLILWGDVRKEQGKLLISARLTVTRCSERTPIALRRMGEFISPQPRHLPLPEFPADLPAALLNLANGLAYYNVNLLERAIKIFERVRTGEGHFYRALCLQRRSQEVSNPQKYLRATIDAYQQLQSPAPQPLILEGDSVAMASRFNRAIALSVLGRFAHPAEGIAYLREAAEVYRAALLLPAQKEFPEDWAATQNNLGVTLRNLGTRLRGEDGNALLREAAEKYQNALAVLSLETHPADWAMAQNNLGVSLNDLGVRLGAEEGNKLLREAVEAYRKALRVRTEKTFPLEQAVTRNNLGNTLNDLGTRLGGEEGKDLLSEAVEAYQGVLRVRTQGDIPQQWATTQNDLGVTLRNLALRLRGRPQCAEFLQQAVEAFRNALKVRTQNELPQDWAMTQNNLGAALGDLGAQLRGEAGNKLLSEAVQAYRQALKVRTQNELPQDWAMTQNNLGNTLNDLATQSEGEQGAGLLKEAVDAYRNALEVYTQKELPQQWAGTHNNLGNALRSLGSHTTGDESLKVLEDAIRSFDNALSVYDEANYPHYRGIVLTNRTEAEDLIRDVMRATKLG
ncbi:MAG: hypothetical protein HY611_08060 [Elusimicrobia bacterium]|nr:hypothetical protein [Elusimicrobiota bacterium]